MRNDHVKSAEELALMRRAARITDDVYEHILGSVREGVTERELADEILHKTLELGAEGVSFDTIVAFGAGGAEPHHVPTDTPLERGMLVTIDMGSVVGGLCSDFTRTFAFGEVGEEEREIYAIVLEAQKRALAAVADGARCSAVDAVARDYIAERGYGEFYIHGTGHGVGYLLNVHEPPVNFRWKEGKTPAPVLEKNMVITDEPGIYIEGSHGIRLENELLVCEDEKNGYGQFMHFEPLTFVPIDLDALLPDEMSEEERIMLNEYHKKVFETVAPCLDDEERAWLKEYTRPV